MRRFLANDPLEKLFFKAASAVGHREAQMVNKVVDYLINEGNLQRALTAFEVFYEFKKKVKKINFSLINKLFFEI